MRIDHYSRSGHTTKERKVELESRTERWISGQLSPGEFISTVERLEGGIAAEVSKLAVADRRTDRTRYLVLRQYDQSEDRDHVIEMVMREVDALNLMCRRRIPVADVVAVDVFADYCESPSLLLTYLPGLPVFANRGIETRSHLLARVLVAIHATNFEKKPADYMALTTADSVVIPPRGDKTVWLEAIRVIADPPPEYEPSILHGDFQPGNVLFADGDADRSEVSGVIDWSGLCLGPRDFDVAHCATNLALLHGTECALTFISEYVAAGGVLSSSESDRRYWLVRDALACSEEYRLWAAPWRKMGRRDLTDAVVESRLCTYLECLMDA